jgi:Na+/H+ antiporter
MRIFELVIALSLVGAVLSLWATRIRLPYPALLALAGAALALIPGVPDVTLDPELALALFVAPALLDAAYDASPRDLRHNLATLLSLAVGAVTFTVAAVAVVARLFVPDMSWAVAITLGAIVAPPDAAAAIAVLRQLRLPHRLLVILHGESLFNDASALVIYRIAAAAALTGSFTGWRVLLTIVVTWGGGVVAGILLARMQLRLTAKLQNIPVSVLLQFVSTFAVWIAAEHVGLSAILAVVSYAMVIAREAPVRGARHRIASYAVWEVVVFVLNVLAFVLIGLQVRGIASRLDASEWSTYGLCAAAICAVVILTRIVWVMGHNAVARWAARRRKGPTHVPSVGSAVIVSWAGMRGIVSLATALALPIGGRAGFPHRDLIVLCAFSVVLITLVLQGLTLGWLIRRVGLRDDGAVEREIGLARAETARVALQLLDADSSSASQMLRREYEARLRSGEEQSAGSGNSSVSAVVADQHRLIAAQRQALLDLRSRNVIGDDAFHATEEELDLLELTTDPRIRAD